MPRSSGQKAMPRRAMRFDGSSIVSVPSNTIEPSRRATMPMIDFSVVVLPAPLRPSSVTTSPSRTSKSTPCRMCDSPYQALRPLHREQAMRRQAWPPQVRLDHLRVLRHRGVVALGEDLAARSTVMVSDSVDTTDRLCSTISTVRFADDALDQRGDALDVLVRHARGRLVEQHHLRVERERGGDLERALAAVGQLDRDGLLELASGPRPRSARARASSSASSTRSERQKSNERAALRSAARCARSRAPSGAGTPPRSGTSAPGPCARSPPALEPVISRPLKKIWPRVGSRKCVSRLKQVVLPAPFGPDQRVDGAAAHLAGDTFLTATKPLNSLVSPRVSRMVSGLNS